MKTINLKKYYYPLYETDTFIELPDEIADAIAEEWRTDHNSEQRLWSHTYSMDYSPGLEYHLLSHALSAEDTKTPVVYAAVSDPEAASLTGIDYVTGTSDALNTSFIMDMMFAQNPDVAKVGLLYSLSEPNSTKPIADAKAYLDAKGIEYVEQTANTNDEVVAAASALIADGVDAVFTPTDNVIMAAELAIYEDLAKAGIPHYTGADSFVRNGAYATCGVNYTDLGAKTADLAYSAITDGMDAMEDYYLMDGGIITVNTDTAAVLKADYSVFAQMAQLVEVTTTKD